MTIYSMCPKLLGSFLPSYIWSEEVTDRNGPIYPLPAGSGAGRGAPSPQNPHSPTIYRVPIKGPHGPNLSPLKADFFSSTTPR